MQHRSVKGLPADDDELLRSSRLIEAFWRMATLHGYQEIVQPVLEHSELFETGAPASKGDFLSAQRSPTLDRMSELSPNRAARADNRTSHSFYVTSQARAIDPSAGRRGVVKRAGCEISGDSSAECDAQMIEMFCDLCDELGVGKVQVFVNCLGGPPARERYRRVLLGYLRPRAHTLSERARSRLEANPLRLFESEDPRDLEALGAAPALVEVLEGDDQKHWHGLKSALDALGTEYALDPRLISGLDYAAHTQFELRLKRARPGGPAVVMRGGRYHTLVSSSGNRVPALGAALHVRSLLKFMERGRLPALPLCVVAPNGPRATRAAYGLARDIRRLGARVHLDARPDDMQNKLERATKTGARLCVIVDERGLDCQEVVFSDPVAGTEQCVPRAALAWRVMEALGSNRRQPSSPSEGAA